MNTFSILILSSTFRKTRTVLFLLIIVFSIDMVSAQDITGKWEVSKEYFSKWNFGYTEVKGHCRFYSNGKFKCILKYRSLFGFDGGHKGRPRTAYTKIAGTYNIKNNTITSKVQDDDLKCYVESGMDDPDITDENLSAPFSLWGSRRVKYRQDLQECLLQENVMKRELLQIWNWNNLPLIKNKDSLIIGEMTIFCK